MKILHLEDDAQDAELVRRTIGTHWPELRIVQCSGRDDYTAALRSAPFDLILSDYTLNGFDGVSALELMKELAPGTPFIFLSGTIGEDRAIEALRAGADDYVIKDRMKRLVPAIHRVLREHDERRQKERLEGQLLRVQRIENIGLLAAGIAHDLNNVLSPILMVAPMLREHVSDPLDLQLLSTLEKSAQRGAALVRQILSFAHGASGQSQVVQVRHLVKDVGDIVAETFPKNIRFVSSFPNDLWPIRANPTHIHQILLNLCVNARDAMPSGGSISVRGGNVVLDSVTAKTIDSARPGSFLFVEVADTGQGITPEVISRMWEPFFTTKDAGKGTGLGLSTVRGIVETCNGFLSVESTVGKGTAFRLYFPVTATTVATQQDEPDQQASVLPRGAGELILFVDDEVNVRDLAAALLSRAGYRVLAVEDGAEAVRIFAQRGSEISLVISDTHMPKMDGHELSRVLKRMNPNVTILAMSGLSQGSGTTPTLTDEGWHASQFLRKPFKPEDLLIAVNGLIAGSKR